MRQFKGIPRDLPCSFTQPIYGRVAAVREQLGSQAVLVATDIADFPFVGLCYPNSDGISSPCIVLDSKYNFCVNDVLRIFPSGKIIFVYEVQSHTNSFFLTDACNSRCLMCPQPPQNASQSYIEDCLQLLNMINDSPEVMGITGGEPTFFWEDLICLIENIRNKYSDCFLQILTNGRSLRMLEKAKEIMDCVVNKDLFCIPIYSDDERIHNRLVGREAFWQTMEGLYNLGHSNASIEIRTVILKHNYKRLKEFSHYIYRNLPFVSHVAFMGMEPVGLAHKNFDDLWVTPSEYAQFLEEAVYYLHMRGIPVSIFNHPPCLLPKSLWRFCSRAISEWKIRYFHECAACPIAESCGGVFASAIQFLEKEVKVPKTSSNAL